jgi:ribosomal protein S18 acetylase RimI-like enzyme
MADIIIRPATRRDATDLVAFVDMAGEGLPAHFWSQLAEAGQGPFEVGRNRALRDEGAFAWKNAWIAEVDGAPAGSVVCYRIFDPVDLSGLENMAQLARDLTLLEAQAPGYWYVNVLATYPEYRGQGAASALLAHAEALGRAAGTKGMAIIVASENERARRLYEHAGYREAARRPLVAYSGFRRGGDWVLLLKPHS